MSRSDEPAPESLLRVECVTKSYRRGVAAYGSLRDAIHRFVRGRREPVRRIEALRDVSLDVAPGACTGIVGVNGAGKSTLLKVIARITPPDAGRIVVGGRLSALIEVGAGFHPELTGRENVMLHGSILGLPRALLRAQMDDVARFAGVEPAMDVPVKQFSTGMYARLGFAVAVHAAPKVLLVDEVLSVGDEAFRERCYARVADLQAGGCAVLFVSHDLPVVERLCGEALWLDGGRVARRGDAREVVAHYRNRTADS